MSADLLEILSIALAEGLSNLHTATIARVETVDETTLECLPVVPRIVDGEAVQLPLFVDVPPIFLQGGGSYDAYPIAPGDYCIIFITERCFDAWYAGQDGTRPPSARMHDYSDGFALVGINPLASAIPIPDTLKRVGNAVHEGNMERTGDTTLTGALDVNGNVEAATFSVGGTAGVTGTYVGNGGTITFVNGIVTGVA